MDRSDTAGATFKHCALSSYMRDIGEKSRGRFVHLQTLTFGGRHLAFPCFSQQLCEFYI